MSVQQATEATERLSAPVGWWLLATGFVLSLGVAVFAFLGPVWGIGVTLVAEAVVVAGLLGYGGTVVRVAADGLHVGRAWIEWPYVGAVTALDDARTLARLRTGADPAAHLVVRPYLRTSVEITLDDPADPHPYWLVSCRDPTRLARAAQTFLDRRQVEAAEAGPQGG